MLRTVYRLFRGIWLMRHPELHRYLGETLTRLQILSEIRSANSTAKLSLDVELIGYRHYHLSLGERVTVAKGSILAFGDEHNGYGTIRVGDRTWIGQYNNLRACDGGDIKIGSQCLISQFCTLVASNHSIERGRPIVEQLPDCSRLGIVIEDDVWLGAGVVIMPGVRLGRGAVIGAHSIVNSSVPEYEVWAGCPARKIRERS